MIDDDRTLDEIEEDSKFLAVAFHEAGHAVVGHRLGYHLESIRVWPDGEDFFGEALFTSLPDDGEDGAIVMAAGAAAHALRQKKLTEHNTRSKYRGGEIVRYKPFPPDLSADDRRAIGRYLNKNYFSGPSGQTEYRRVTTRAQKLVAEYWSEIVDVAKALNGKWDGEGDVRLDRKAFLKAVDTN